MIDYELVNRVLKREHANATAYLKGFPEKPPGPRAKGKTAAWRQFRQRVEEHGTRCEMTMSAVMIRKRMGMW